MVTVRITLDLGMNMGSEIQARGAHAGDALARFSTPLKHAIPGACFIMVPWHHNVE